MTTNIIQGLKRLFPGRQHRFLDPDVLIDCLKEKDSAAIEFLMERCQGSVRKITHHYRLSKDSVSDALADGIMLLIDKINEGTYNPNKASPQTYLIGICKNILANHSRKKSDPISQSLEDVEIPDHSFEELMNIKERISLLDSLLNKLGAPCNQLITLKYLDGYSDKEIIAKDFTSYTSLESLRVSRQQCMKKLTQLAQSAKVKQDEIRH